MLLDTVLPKSRTERILAAGALADSMGTGLYTTAGILYFTRFVGLSAAEIGLGMAAAGVAGFLAAVPLGHLADRWGARDVAIGLAIIQAVLMAAFAVVGSFPGYLVVVTLFCAAERGTWTARSAMLAALVPGRDRVRAQAYMRSVFNLGVAAGALLAGAALQADSRGLYLAVILGNAASFALYAAFAGRLPRVRRVVAKAGSLREALPVLRDWPYLSLGLLNGFLSIHASVLLIGLPLWLSEHTSAPPVLISWLFLLNTAMAVLLQVRASRKAGTVRGAGRALALSAAATAAACLLLAPAANLPVWAAAGILTAGTAVLTVGELLQSAGSWGLSFGLAKGEAHGSHQGAFSLGDSLKDVLGPLLVVSVAIALGPIGWVVLAALFALGGALVAPATRWAQGHRSRPEPVTPAAPVPAMTAA